MMNIDKTCHTEEIDVETVTISPKFQVVIPLAIRKAMKLSAGQRVLVVERDGRIELLPLRPIGEYEGMLRGNEVGFEREDDRE